MSEHDARLAVLGSLLTPHEFSALLEQRGLSAHVELRDAQGRSLPPELHSELLAELRSAREKFEHLQRLASIGALAAGMAHEARNLLTGSLGFTQLIAAKPHDVEGVREMARTIESELRRCVGLLASFLRLSRSGSEPLRELSLGEIISPVERLVDQPLRQRDCTLTVALASPLPCVAGRASELQRVLINLIYNAADAAQAGGHVWLTARVAADGGIEISVTDDGPGVPSELAERIFEPFFSTKGAQGTGLGLALSRSIAEAHCGALTLHHSLGRGATFTLKLPACGSGGAP